MVEWIPTLDTDHYEVWRNNGSGWAVVANSPFARYEDFAIAFDAAYLYRVRAVAPGGAPSGYSAADLAVASGAGSIFAGNAVRILDLYYLRRAANAVRAVASLPAINWTDPTAQLTHVRAIHLAELRTAIQQARATLGLSAPAYSETPAAGTKVKALHFIETGLAME